MHIRVEIGTFDHDVVLALNYAAVFKVSFAPRGSVLAHLFNCYVAVDCIITHNVPLDTVGDKVECGCGIAQRKASQVAMIFACVFKLRVPKALRQRAHL